MFELFLHASALIKVVLVILAGLSVMSWGIILYKALHLQIASHESNILLASFHAAES